MPVQRRAEVLAVTWDQLPLLLTVEEAAAVMRISRTGAYNAVAEGAVPSVRIGRTIRIPRDRLARGPLGLGDSFGDDATTPAAPEPPR